MIDEPREWWIDLTTEWVHNSEQEIKDCNVESHDIVRVIEYAALEKAKDEIQALQDSEDSLRRQRNKYRDELEGLNQQRVDDLADFRRSILLDEERAKITHTLIEQQKLELSYAAQRVASSEVLTERLSVRIEKLRAALIIIEDVNSAAKESPAITRRTYSYGDYELRHIARAALEEDEK